MPVVELAVATQCSRPLARVLLVQGRTTRLTEFNSLIEVKVKPAAHFALLAQVRAVKPGCTIMVHGAYIAGPYIAPASGLALMAGMAHHSHTATSSSGTLRLNSARASAAMREHGKMQSLQQL